MRTSTMFVLFAGSTQMVASLFFFTINRSWFYGTMNVVYYFTLFGPLYCWYRFCFDTPTLFFPHWMLCSGFSFTVFNYISIKTLVRCVAHESRRKNDKYPQPKVNRKPTEKSEQCAAERYGRYCLREKLNINIVYKQLPLYALNGNQ